MQYANLELTVVSAEGPRLNQIQIVRLESGEITGAENAREQESESSILFSKESDATILEHKESDL